jgi:hypothetical protein
MEGFRSSGEDVVEFEPEHPRVALARAVAPTCLGRLDQFGAGPLSRTLGRLLQLICDVEEELGLVRTQG